jgi:hypothetical protein
LMRKLARALWHVGRGATFAPCVRIVAASLEM